MKRYTVIARPDDISSYIRANILDELGQAGLEYDEKNPEVIFVVGGDGTFIHAVHTAMKTMGIKLKDTCFYGIHTGTLGFYSDFKDTEYREYMDTFLNGTYKEISYPLLQVTYHDHHGEYKHHAINEVRVENAAKTQRIDVSFNGKYFETFRGTGLNVCTQLGSSAYNRSLGGAIMQEGLDFIELTEIAGIHHVKFRSLNSPLILKSDTLIEFRSESFEHAVLGCDSSIYDLTDVNSLRIRITKSTAVRTLRGKNVSYFERLRSLF
ncbi:MAG: NAD(+)/NADH kinase [Solobacterium sp.]|nr:NAD(+)/NADH kinase [Solobacterium sp.]